MRKCLGQTMESHPSGGSVSPRRNLWTNHCLALGSNKNLICYIMQLLVPYISRPKPHLNPIHCVFILLAMIINQDNKYCMSPSSFERYCCVLTCLIVNTALPCKKPYHYESACHTVL